MAFGFVRSTQSSGGPVTTFPVTVPAVRTGDLLVVNIKFSANVTGVSITDNASVPNTYALALGAIGSAATWAHQFYGVAVTGGATTITINWTTSTSIRVTIDEFSGGQKTNAAVFDKAASSSTTGTSTSVTLSPTNAGELICAGYNLGGAITSPINGANYLFGTNNNAGLTQYRKVGTTSETAPLTWTTSVLCVEIAGAYIPIDSTSNFFEFM